MDRTHDERKVMRSLKNFLSLVTAVTMLGLGWTSTAGAADYFVFGQWHQQRGKTVGIPVGNGGNINQAASAMATQMGTGPATIVLEVGAFARAAVPFTIPIASRTTIQQLATSFNFAAPQAGNQTLAPGVKASRPANFSACPGQLTGCATVNGGTKNGRVQYTAGPNNFGGSMNMLIDGSGTLSRVVPGGTGGACPAAPGGNCPIVDHDQIGGIGLQAPGFSPGLTDINSLPAGARVQVLATGGCPAPLSFLQGCILSSTPVAGTGPGGGSTNYGFPWTTGKISATATLGPATPNTTLVQTGTDMRTSMGSGRLTLVGSSVSQRFVGVNYVSIDTITMTLAPVAAAAAAPALAPVGIASFTALMALAGGYGLSRRNRRNR
ncbi:MAG: hypothetical protein MK108_19450 [Mariniblastus sp.]|nr:hypothetical protein [Mariniblastus sp.]